MDIFRVNAEHPTQGVEDVQEHTKQRIAQEGLTSAPHVRGHIELQTGGARPGKSRRNRRTRSRGRRRSGSRSGGRSGGRSGSRSGGRSESRSRERRRFKLNNKERTWKELRENPEGSGSGKGESQLLSYNSS